MKITYLLINLNRSPERLARFKNDMKRHDIRRIKAINYTEKIVTKNLKRQLNFFNIKLNNKRKNLAISLSHFKCLKYIIRHKLNNVVILEDDTIIDYAGVRKIAPSLPRDFITQLGGEIWPPTFSQKLNEWKAPRFKKGLNVIDISKYHIMGAWGYFIPTWEVARALLKWIYEQKRWRNYDNLIEKSPQKKYFYYPALVTLHDIAQISNAGHVYHTKNFDSRYYWMLRNP